MAGWAQARTASVGAASPRRQGSAPGLRAQKADSKSELGSYSDPTRSVHGIISIKRGCRVTVSGQLQFNLNAA